DSLNFYQPLEPAIDTITKTNSLCVPTARTIEAQIRSAQTPASVVLKYAINTGASQSVNMTLVGTNWTGTIPAAGYGDSITYFVEATPTGGASVLSAVYN